MTTIPNDLKRKIRDLCEEYVWWTIMSIECGSTLSDNRRVQIHEAIAKLLEIEVWDGCFSIFHHLEDLGFALSPVPNPELWEGVAKVVGKKAFESMLQEL